jgi:hypothetical protein
MTLSWGNMWSRVWSICFLGLEYAISKVVPGFSRNLDPHQVREFDMSEYTQTRLFDYFIIRF